METSNSEAATSLQQEPVLRGDLVKTAIDFLKIPRVTSSSIDRKRSFLLSKGLTDVEIDAAFIQAGISMENRELDQLYHGEKPSTWTSLGRFSLSTAIIGGILYGGYKLYKTYIQPKILSYFGNRLDAIEGKLDNIAEVVRNLETKSSADKDLNSILMNASRPNAAEIHAINELKTEIHAVTQLKTEIASVKALILSKNSLGVKSASDATIPAWQLDEPITNGEAKKQSTTSSPEVDSD